MVDVTTPVPANTPIGLLIGGKLFGLNLLAKSDGTVIDPATDAKLEDIRALLAAALPLPTGAATSAKQDALATQIATLLSQTDQIEGYGANTVAGLATLAGLLGGTLTVGLPAGASSETTLAALSGKLPVSLGAKAGSGSLSIVPSTGADLATNASITALATALAPAKAATATQATVAASSTAGGGTLLPTNTARIGAASVYYDGAAILYLLEGSGTPSATNFTIKLGAGLLTYYETQGSYTGPIKGVWSAATGAANVTERTA